MKRSFAICVGCLVVFQLFFYLSAGVSYGDIEANTAYNRKIYVGNYGYSSVSVIDGFTNTVVKTIPVPGSNTGAITVTGVDPITKRIYVIKGSNTISVIDGSTDTLLTEFSEGYVPDIAVDSSRNRIYISGNWPSRLVVRNGSDYSLIASFNVGTHYCCDPGGAAVNESTNRIYVVNLQSNTVSVIDGDSNTVIATIPISGPGGTGSMVGINSSTNRIYVTNRPTDHVSVIDGDSNTVIATIPAGSYPLWVDVNRTTNRIYVGNYGSNNVSVIDGLLNTVIATIPVENHPAGIAVNENTNFIYVPNNNNVSVIDGTTNTVTATVTGVPGTSGIAVLSSPNTLPVANAGPDQTANCSGPNGTAVTLNGFGSSDPDGDALTYKWTWASGSAEGVNPTITLPLGITTITLIVTDEHGASSSPDTVDITVQDNLPPSTSAAITGTSGNNGWYKSEVNVSLASTDDCSGVKEIHYILDGAETIISGSTAGFTISADGTHTLTYWSVDNAGLIETAHPLIVKIDKTKPALTIFANPGMLWPPNHKMVPVTINGSADDGISGMKSVVITVADEYGKYNQTITSGFGSIINLEAWREGTDKDGRVYTITVVAADRAGNQSTATTMVTVPHDMRNK